MKGSIAEIDIFLCMYRLGLFSNRNRTVICTDVYVWRAIYKKEISFLWYSFFGGFFISSVFCFPFPV